jgi:hypothetical protein
MSWDVTIMKLPSKVTKIEEIDESEIDELGNRDEIVKKLIKLFPHADFSDESWGLLEREGYSIEFNIPEEFNLTSIMLHVRGDNRSLNAIKLICSTTGWKAIDEEIIDFNNKPESGLEQWQHARQLMLMDIRKRKKKWYEFWK